MADQNVEKKDEVLDPKQGSKKDDNPKKKGNNSKKHKGKKSGKPGKPGKPMPNKGDNDVSWYTKYPNLIAAQSGLFFNKRYGHTYKAMTVTSSNSIVDMESVPGVVSYEFTPMYAESGSDSSACNVTLKNYQAWLRHANSGSVNYEGSDLMQATITFMNLYMHCEQLKRDLRMVLTFNPVNAYVFRSALIARGYNASEITNINQNYANYIGQINLIVARLNTFKIPKDMPIVDRHCWLVSNLWKDDELDKSSYYLFQTNSYAHYDWANAKVTVNKDYSLTTFQSRINKIVAEIDNLIAYDDIATINGDILKAYKQEGCRVLTPMSTGEALDAAKSNEALLQFKNAVCIGSPISYTIQQVSSNSQLLEVKQGNNPSGEIHVSASYAASVSSNFNKIDFNPLISIDSNEPTNAEVIIATRLMVSAEITPNDTDYECDIKVTDYGTEILEFGKIYLYDDKFVLQNYTFTSFRYLNYDSVNGTVSDLSDALSSATNLIGIKSILERVSCTPALYTLMDAGTGVLTLMSEFSGKNVQNTTAVWLKNLHDSCKMSEYSLPMFKLLMSN